MPTPKPIVSVIINAHNEPTQWIRRAVRSVTMQRDAPDHEIILVHDNPTPAVRELCIDLAKDGVVQQELETRFGDLGLARNEGVKFANGRFVQFLDGDDMLGATWLRDAFTYAKRFDNDDFVLHPEYSCMFGAAQFFHRHVGDDSPEYDPRGFVQWNHWSALAFAPKDLFERFPYESSDDTWTNEDYGFNTTTVGEGVVHRCVPGAVHFVRMKLDQSSMSARMSAAGGVQRRRKLFDRRNLQPPQQAPNLRAQVPESVYKQALFAHHEVGEKQLVINGEMQIRVYPPANSWDDQAWVRDQIGDAKHVVLVQTLPGGGAEKFATNWANAVVGSGNADVVVIETAPEQPREHRSGDDDVLKFVQWHRRRNLNDVEEAMALQRALIQADLDSVFVVNSALGLALVNENPKCLAKRVFVASFASIPQPGGFSSAPPFWFKKREGFTVVTDNNRHAVAMHEYNGVNVRVVRPKVVYGGKSKLRQVGSDRPRVLWAGRGTIDKQPHVVAELAMHMPEIDFHVWGDVPRVPSALLNLKYRGPFENFESIDGSYDCYLMTSINEGMPHTALEASLAGLPVIAPDVGDLAAVALKTFPMQIGKPVDLTPIIHALRDMPTNTGGQKAHMAATWAEEFDGAVRALVLG